MVLKPGLFLKIRNGMDSFVLLREIPAKVSFENITRTDIAPVSVADTSCVCRPCQISCDSDTTKLDNVRVSTLKDESLIVINVIHNETGWAAIRILKDTKNPNSKPNNHGLSVL